MEDEEFKTADNLDENLTTSPVEIDQTKAFATRLKEEKAKAKAETREEIAQSFGYGSWQEYVDAQTNNKLIDKGFDPEDIKPMLKDLIKGDPDYIEAMKYKSEKEALEKELFATNSIKELNDTFGLNIKSVDELDKDTVEMWNNGIPLKKAYVANNWSKLQERSTKTMPVDNGKSHLKNVNGGNIKSQEKQLSVDELKIFNMFGFSSDEAKAYVNKKQ